MSLWIFFTSVINIGTVFEFLNLNSVNLFPTEGLFPPESEGRFLLCNVGSSGGQWAALLRLLGLSPLVSSVYLTLFSLSQRTELIRGGPTGEWRFMLREIGHLSLAKLQHLVMILRAKLSVKWNRNIYSWAHLVQPHFPSAEADLLQLI